MDIPGRWLDKSRGRAKGEVVDGPRGAVPMWCPAAGAFCGGEGGGMFRAGKDGGGGYCCSDEPGDCGQRLGYPRREITGSEPPGYCGGLPA